MQSKGELSAPYASFTYSPYDSAKAYSGTMKSPLSALEQPPCVPYIRLLEHPSSPHSRNATYGMESVLLWLWGSREEHPVMLKERRAICGGFSAFMQQT